MTYKDFKKKNYSKFKKFKTRKSFHEQTSKTTKFSPKDLQQAREETFQQLQIWRGNSNTTKETAKITLDPWQKEAISAFQHGCHVIVDAPTTAGKTCIIEQIFLEKINLKDFRSCYTTPVKSLANDKFREFKEMFGKDSVGIATGDMKENLNAPIIVATLETYRNSLLGAEPDLNRNLVVYDEYHFLQDKSRGSAWEEAIILTSAQTQMILLSASIANPEKFADWIEIITERKTKLIQTQIRPVPLVDLVWLQGSWLLPKSCGLNIKARDKKQAFHSRFQGPSYRLKDLVASLEELMSLELSPCLMYAARRLQCQSLAETLSAYLSPPKKTEKNRLLGLLEKIDKENSYLNYLPDHLRQMIEEHAIAYHHSGLTPAARIVIEILLKAGALRFCISTMGLSLGVNFSVKSVLILDYKRPDESGEVFYSVSETLQMTGRAGRRGKDSVGLACWFSLDHFTILAGAQRQTCDSQLKHDPATYLGLVSRKMKPEDILNLYSSSFAVFQQKAKNLALISYDELSLFLRSKELPCQSPADAFAKFTAFEHSPCYDCTFFKKCHQKIRRDLSSSSLSSLQLHLHIKNCLSQEDELTDLGNLARHFPQSGGLLIASMIYKNKINANNILATAQLMAACSLTYYKKIPGASLYKFPWSENEILKEIKSFYPDYLFPELYEKPYKSRHTSPLLQFRDYNPQAGFVVLMWEKGISWEELVSLATSRHFGPGDISNCLLRTCSYLQALSQAKQNSSLAHAASELKKKLLRPPILVF